MFFQPLELDTKIDPIVVEDRIRRPRTGPDQRLEYWYIADADADQFRADADRFGHPYREIKIRSGETIFAIEC